MGNLDAVIGKGTDASYRAFAKTAGQTVPNAQQRKASKAVTTPNAFKTGGNLDSVIGQGADPSYTAFRQQQVAQQAVQKQQSGQPATSAALKVPTAPAPANPTPKGIMGKVSTYGKAFVTSPGGTIKDIVTGQGIKAVDNGAIIVNRAPVAVTSKIRQAQAGNVSAGTPSQLDHTQALEIGGDNNPKNLKLIPKTQDVANNPVENYLGAQLRANKINAQQAQQLMSDFKSGKVSAQDTVNRAQQQPKGKSLLSKTGAVAKGFASAATSGEQALAKPIARLLPGGQNDLKAENEQIDQNIKTMQMANKMIQSGNPRQVATGKKLLAQNKIDQANTSKEVSATGKEIKAETNRGHIALGAASTAADILTAGQLPGLKALKGTSLLSKTGRVAEKGAQFGTAGALNSAAGGGTKKQVAENFVAGAALPGVLHVAGKGISAAADRVVGGQTTKDLITNAKTQNLLSEGSKVPGRMSLGKSAISGTVPQEVSHITPAAKLPAIIADGKLTASSVPVEGFEGKHGVFLQTGTKNDFYHPGEPNVKIVYKEPSAVGQHEISGDQVRAHNDVPVNPGIVDRIEIPTETMRKPLEAHGYKVVVNPDLENPGASVATARSDNLKLPSGIINVNEASKGLKTAGYNLQEINDILSQAQPKTVLGRPGVHTTEIHDLAAATDRSSNQGAASAEGSVPKTVAPAPETTPAAPTSRVPAEVLSDIKANTDAVREASNGKVPADYAGSEASAPKEVQPLLARHVELQKEYIAAQAAHAPKPVDTGAVKSQIKSILNEDKNYDANGNVTPEAAKQITALHKQLNAAGERIPKSEKPVTVTPVESTKPTETPDIQTSKLAQGVEDNAVRKGLTQGFEGKPEYAKVNIPQQTKAATDLIKTDPERAIRIAMGHEKPPEGLLPESVFIAVEHTAAKTGNVDLLRRLATESKLTSEATGMGQRIRMLGERENHSPVAAIKKVQEARTAAFEKRTGKSAPKAISDEIKAIRAAKPRPTKLTWNTFVESIKC